MIDTAIDQADRPGGLPFIYRFMMLAVVSGGSIALGRIATQLFAIHLAATSLQIGVIMAVEQAAMVTMAVPAGFLISRLGVRAAYFTASLGPMLVYAVMPFAATWQLLALARGLIGLCIPFRINSMNTSFLRELPRIGAEKAGWYRGSQTIGMALVGPGLAAWVTGHHGFGVAFVASGVMFGLMGLFSLSFFPDTRADADADAAGAGIGIRRQLLDLLRQRAIFESCLIEHVASATTALFSTFILIVAIKTLGLPHALAVALIAIQGVTTIASLFLGSRVYVRLTRHRGYLLSLVITIASLLCLGLGGSWWALAAGASLLSLGSTMIHFQTVTQLSRNPANKSKVSGLYNLAGMSGGVVGALGGGLYSAAASVQSVFLLWILVVLAAAAVIAIRSRKGDADA